MSWWSPEREPNVVLPDPDTVIREQEIFDVLERTKNPTLEQVRAILRKARSNALLEHTPESPKDEFVQALNLEECATLLNIPPENKELMNELFATALEIKQRIYGDRIVLFAPLYASNWCTGSCMYCAYRGANHDLHRHALSKEQLIAETEALQRTGHKRIVMLCGEHPNYPFEQFLEDLKTVHSVHSAPHGEIRRINVEIPALSVFDMKRLKASGCVGTVTLFQETYHRATFRKMHPYGPKSDFNWRILNMDRAQLGGCDDVGLGALYGLFDYRYEVLGLMQHAEHLDKTYGAGPHTISIPRIQPAPGAVIADRPPFVLDDENFKKVVAILRISVPYTGMILSTRESPAMRNECIRLGISQMSAGSHVDVGSYSGALTGSPSAGISPEAIAARAALPPILYNNKVPPLEQARHTVDCPCPQCHPKGAAAPAAAAPAPAPAAAAPAAAAPAAAAPAAATPAASAAADAAPARDIESMAEAMPALAAWCDPDAKKAAPVDVDPGAPAAGANAGAAGQFTVSDTRPMLEVVKNLMQQGRIPSWCTACYRCKRTGANFMKICKKGLIQDFCQPNALLTLAEYLIDYGDDEVRTMGWALIDREALKIKSDRRRQAFREKLELVKRGARDLYF